MLGKRINGRYQLLETIGGGGMANVYKAHDAILNRTVAVKVLRPQFSDDEEFIRRFRREAQAATSLSHPNVVNIFDVGEEDQLYYIVMEYVPGLTLKQLIQKRGTLPIEEIVHIMAQIASAIAHAHANQIVHRDIKPHNILISETGEAKVTDFGIARAMTSATITHTNSVMGSVHYLSPEQARGGLVNEKSDIYSLGIVLYEMVTGEVPFSGDTAVSIAIKHLQTEVPLPRKVNPMLPQSIENIILKATAKDPFHRYVNVKEMERDIHTALDPDRRNEAKFVIPNDNDDVTKAIPIIKDNQFNGDLDETKISMAIDENKQATPIKNTNKKKKWLKLTLISLFLFFCTVIVAFVIIPKWLHVDEVLIPENLEGELYEDVFDTLTSLHLNVEKETMLHDEIIEGHVISTNPESGKMVKVNTTIKVFVSEGKPKVEMIDVTEENIDIAIRRLIKLGFKEESIQQSHEESDIKENTVIKQTPVVGEMIVPEETTVFLTYSIPAKFSMGNLANYTREEVLEYGRKHGLIINIKEQYSDRIPVNHVIEQLPSRDTTVVKGTEVTVYLSLGPEPEPEPEPISTFIEYVVPVSETDQVAGTVYAVTITYKDSTTQEHKPHVIEQLITKPQSFKVPVTIRPNDLAELNIYIGDELFHVEKLTYNDAMKRQ